MSEGHLILYKTPDGATQVSLKERDGTVWLTQIEIAELFQTSKQNVSHHIQSVFEDKELMQEATVKYHLTVQTEGKRQVQRDLALYNLDMILAIGYRVRSERGTQFRQWTTTALRDYLVKLLLMVECLPFREIMYKIAFMKKLKSFNC